MLYEMDLWADADSLFLIYVVRELLVYGWAIFIDFAIFPVIFGSSHQRIVSEYCNSDRLIDLWTRVYFSYR